MPPVPARSIGIKPNPVDMAGRSANRMGSVGACAEAHSLDFYYGKINNDLVEELLRPWMDVRGTYLLRDSNTEPGVITISVVDSPRHIYNFKVSCKSSGLYEVTENLKFSSLKDLVSFFAINEVPGRDISCLKLVKPVRYRTSPQTPPPNSLSNPPMSPPKSPPKSPPRTSDGQPPVPSIPPRPRRISQPTDNHLESTGKNESGSSFLDFRGPVPIPKSGTEPVYIFNDHIYCRAEDLQKSKLNEIVALCKISDMKYTKCSCGLYLEESMLIYDWMMHIDRPTGNRTGRVFFVNAVFNKTLWELPSDVMLSLEKQYPDKYRSVQKLLQEGHTL